MHKELYLAMKKVVSFLGKLMKLENHSVKLNKPDSEL